MEMECACCGQYAGRWKQWWNQDETYGVCKDCVEWLTEKRNTSAEELTRLYGNPDIHRPRAQCEMVVQ